VVSKVSVKGGFFWGGDVGDTGTIVTEKMAGGTKKKFTREKLYRNKGGLVKAFL